MASLKWTDLSLSLSVCERFSHRSLWWFLASPTACSPCCLSKAVQLVYMTVPRNLSQFCVFKHRILSVLFMFLAKHQKINLLVCNFLQTPRNCPGSIKLGRTMYIIWDRNIFRSVALTQRYCAGTKDLKDCVTCTKASLLVLSCLWIMSSVHTSGGASTWSCYCLSLSWHFLDAHTCSSSFPDEAACHTWACLLTEALKFTALPLAFQSFSLNSSWISWINGESWMFAAQRHKNLILELNDISLLPFQIMKILNRMGKFQVISISFPCPQIEIGSPHPCCLTWNLWARFGTNRMDKTSQCLAEHRNDGKRFWICIRRQPFRWCREHEILCGHLSLVLHDTKECT